MRYFCHHCHSRIAADELLPDFLCPQCHSGFVEEMPSSRRSSSLDESQRAASDDGAGFIPVNDDFSDDNSDVEFLDAYNGSIAQVFELIQPQQHQSSNNDANESNPQGQSSESSTNQQSDQNRRLREPMRTTTRSSSGLRPTVTYSNSNQSLADVLTDFISGVSFGTQYPEGAASGAPNVLSGTGGPMGANRGLINIDFPLPFFLHSNPGDYAWGNSGFDAVITQLLNNLDGSNSGPPPMPKDQVDNLPVVKIEDDQVKKTNLQCTVCMDDFQLGDCARQLPCEHFFHQDCIIPWLNIHASCPICRKTFINSGASPSQVNTGENHRDGANISSTNVTQESNPNVSTTSTSATTQSATTNRNPAGTAASSATVSNQTSAPSYDYTEDDCD